MHKTVARARFHFSTTSSSSTVEHIKSLNKNLQKEANFQVESRVHLKVATPTCESACIHVTPRILSCSPDKDPTDQCAVDLIYLYI